MDTSEQQAPLPVEPIDDRLADNVVTHLYFTVFATIVKVFPVSGTTNHTLGYCYSAN